MKLEPSVKCDNPNVGRNRIPGSNELATLLNLARNYRKIIEEYGRQLKEQQNTYTEIQLRYHQQKEILDGIASELHTTADFIHTVEGQKEAAENNLARLGGLVHPIRRCPSDILAYIFEWIVLSVDEEKEEREIRAATNLSHVCSHWRSVALHLPSIWSTIEVSNKCNVNDLKAYWERTVQRVKSIPVRVRIEATGPSDQMRSKCCSLDLLPHIEELHLSIGLYVPAEVVFNWLPNPRGELDHLYLGYHDEQFVDEEDEDDEGPPILSLDEVTRAFPTCRHISIYSCGSLVLTARQRIPAQKVDINASCSLSLQWFVSTFPHAHDVELESIDFEETTGFVEWPSLQTLSVSGCPDFPWDRLVANDLVTFSTHFPTERMFKFLDRCESLRHLETKRLDGDLRTVYRLLPRLLSLTIDACPDIVDENMPDLRNLATLGVYQSEDEEMPLSLFDAIVSRHLLPHQDRTSNNDAPARKLKMMVKPELGDKPLKWQASCHLHSALEVKVLKRVPGTYWNTYTYGWL